MKTRLQNCKHQVIAESCTQCKPPHTPTPWTDAEMIDLYENGDQYTPQFLVDRLGISRARAAFIVRAVNSHEGMVDLLKKLALAGDFISPARQEDIKNCLQAIAQAEKI